MPESTTTIPGVGKLSGRQRTIVGLAAATGVGIVVYAWWSSRGSAGQVEAEVLVPEEPTGVLPFGGTQSGTFTEGPVAYRNDAEWYKDAVDRLTLDYGVPDIPTASAALDRYLASQPLTAAQVPMITYVVNTIGPPPSGAKTIRKDDTPAPPPSVPALSAPVLTATKRQGNVMRFVWSGVIGATGYDVARGNAVTGKMGGASRTTKLVYDWRYSTPGTRLLLFVRARGPNNQVGPWASLMAIG